MRRTWRLTIKKSYVEMVFEFSNAEEMARFLNHFTNCYVEDKYELEMSVESVPWKSEPLKKEEEE